MSAELVPMPRRDLVRAGFEHLPAAIGRAGDAAAWRFIEFFTATIRNKNTRTAYAQAIGQFFAWCEKHRVRTLPQISPIVIATYIENHPSAPPTVKQHLAAIRMLFDFLVTGQILPVNPASSVRGPKFVVKRGKTPVLTADQARTLLDSIRTDTVFGLRDRAIIALMCYTFARVSAMVHMNIEDYYLNGKRWWVRLHEKGGKRHEVPCHHNAEAYLDAYLDASGIRDEKKSPLFRSVDKSRKLTANPMTRTDVLRMVKRRAMEAGLPSSTCCHTFRATGIRPISKTAGRSRMRSSSPRTSRRSRRSCTTGREMRSRSMRWRGL
jgi:integrase/recombinase XerD